jgi:hypothetical protein
MNRWSGDVLRVVLAFVIVLLAGVVSISVSAVFHPQRNLITGIAFLAAVVCLVLFFERIFPSVYSGLRRGPRLWWQWRGSVAIDFGIIISILSSRIATLWFGLLIISGVLVALLLRVARRDGEL